MLIIHIQYSGQFLQENKTALRPQGQAVI